MSKKENVLGLDLKADSVGASDSGKVFQNLGQKLQISPVLQPYSRDSQKHVVDRPQRP